MSKAGAKDRITKVADSLSAGLLAAKAGAIKYIIPADKIPVIAIRIKPCLYIFLDISYS